MNIQTAAAQMKATFKKVGHTNVAQNDNCAILFHYDTPIVTVANNQVLIANGGHYSVTTKKFINRALQAIGLDATISQRKGVWYLSANGTESEFNRNALVPANN